MGWAERENPNSEYNRKNRREKEGQMWEKLGRAIKRLARGALALLIAGGVAAATKDPKWIALAPLINATAKWLRDTLGLKNIPL
jgi:hypothetical protein